MAPLGDCTPHLYPIIQKRSDAIIKARSSEEIRLNPQKQLEGRLFLHLEKITLLWRTGESDEVLKSEPGTSKYRDGTKFHLKFDVK